MNYYDILEISPKASEEVLKMAYKALARKYHPDVCNGNVAVAEEKMKELNQAYSTLSDNSQRKIYDIVNNINQYNSEQAYYNNQESSSKVASPKKSYAGVWSVVMILVIIFILIVLSQR